MSSVEFLKSSLPGSLEVEERNSRIENERKQVLHLRRDAMKDGPIFLEKKNGELRSPRSVFDEYYRTLRPVMYKDDLGFDHIGIVEREVKSRNSGVEKTGKYLDPINSFRNVALLALHISYYDKGKFFNEAGKEMVITEREVFSQFSDLTASGWGNKNIESLRMLLGQELGSIKGSKFQEEKGVEKRGSAAPKMVMVPINGEGTGDADSHHFEFVRLSQLQQDIINQQQEREKEIAGRRIKVMTTAGLTLVSVSACSPVVAEAIGSIVTPEASSVPTKVPTTEATKVPTAESPEATPTPVFKAAGGEFSKEQNDFLETQTGKDYLAAMKAYIEYWAKVGLIGSDAIITYGAITDINDSKNLDKMGFWFEISGPDFAGFKCTIPYSQVLKYMETGDPETMLPPQGDVLLTNADIFKMSTTVMEGSVPANLGILVGSVLGYIDQNWVYLNPIDGAVVGRVNKEGMWEKEGIQITGEIFQDPHLMKDMATVVEVPNPVSKPEEYQKYMDEIGKMVDEYLKTYSGPTINLESGTIGINYGDNIISITDQSISAIATVKFVSNNKISVGKFFATEAYGKKSYIFVLHPHDFMLYGSDSNEPFNYSTSATNLNVRYRAEGNGVITDFSKKYLGSLDNEDFLALQRVLMGNGNISDFEKISKMKFVIMMVN